MTDWVIQHGWECPDCEPGVEMLGQWQSDPKAVEEVLKLKCPQCGREAGPYRL